MLKSNIIKVIKSGGLFNFLCDYEKYNNLSKEDFRILLKEYDYAVSQMLLESDKVDFLETVAENLEDYVL